MGKWASVSLARAVAQHYREGWRALPRDIRRKWLILVGAGTVGMFVLMTIVQKILQQMISSGSVDWERAYLAGIEAHPPFGFSSAVWYQTLGTDITMWILIALMAGIFAWNRRPIAASSLVLGWIVLDLVVRFSWATWDRERPDIVAQGLARPGFASFPSGHTGKTFVVYGVLCYLWFRSSRSWVERTIAVIIPFLFAWIVGLSRIRMGVHWPTDVLGGLLMGIAWLAVLIVGMRMEVGARQSAGTRASSERHRRVAR